MADVSGAYYLHENGTIHWVNVHIFCNMEDEYFDSPFVKKVWYISDYISVALMLREAVKLGANVDDLRRIAKQANYSKQLEKLLSDKKDHGVIFKSDPEDWESFKEDKREEDFNID
jgi:hypothetical protein